MGQVETNNPWTKKHIDILKEWKAKCFVYLWLHDKSSYYYTCLQNYLSYPVIIFSSIASATLLSSTNIIARYCVGTLSLCSGILTSILRHLKPGELLQTHIYFTRKYHALIRNIDVCLSTTYVNRPNPDAFIEKIGSEIDVMLANQIDPPICVIRQFENKYGSLACILYGDDIIELIRAEIATNKMFHRYSVTIRNDDNTPDGDVMSECTERRNASLDIRQTGSFELPMVPLNNSPFNNVNQDGTRRSSTDIRRLPYIPKQTTIYEEEKSFKE